MNDELTEFQSDVWSDWLLNRRHAADPEYEKIVQAAVERYADRVLDGVRLAPGMTLVDVGAGEGLVAFRAISRIGESLRAVLTDISRHMLNHAETLAVLRGIRQQCAFFECSAEDLQAIDDASVDAITARAVLAYVADKQAALREFFRTLKPGGRLSIAEPIFQDEAFAVRDLKKIIDAQPEESKDRFLSLFHRWKAAQFPDTDEGISASPLTNFSERSLVHFVQTAGLSDIHRELHIDLAPSEVGSWERFIAIPPPPLAPPLSKVIEEQFTPEERQFFEQMLRPTVEDPKAVSVVRSAYLTATRPPT